MAGPKSIGAAELRSRLHDGGEIAIVDAREEGSFHERHLLMAACLPLSRLELIAPALLPRRTAPIVVCDDTEGLAERAAARLVDGGWSDVAVLAGGVAAWEAGRVSGLQRRACALESLCRGRRARDENPVDRR